KAIAYFEGLAKSGRVHGHHEFVSVTGNPGGFMMAWGDLDEIMKILVEEQTLKLNNQARSGARIAPGPASSSPHAYLERVCASIDAPNSRRIDTRTKASRPIR